jgi:arsenite methyltransferase
MAQLEFDDTVAQQLEALYNARDVRRRRALVTEALAAASGDRIIDVGCGPGFYLAELVDVVGANGSLLGLDMSQAMIALAQKRTAGLANVAVHQAELSAIPAPDDDFDKALCVQVMEYVTDPEPALCEIRRVLRPGGTIVVWDVDWSTLSWHSSDVERMGRILSAWDHHLAHPALPRRLGSHLRGAGFADVAMAAHVFATDRLDPETYGGVTLPLITAFVAGREEVGRDELDAWRLDQQELDQRGEFYFSCVQVCFVATKPG